ncbi:response regulator [bacterium]|nr:response regulator [bacterium]
MSIDCRPNILVVEDEAPIAADLEGRLNDLGYRVCGCADNYVEALEVVDLYRPDLVLLDLCLQGERDGIQLARQLRNKGPIPFIYLTAATDAPTLLRATQTRPAGYVHKPLRTQDLDTAIQIALLQIRRMPLSQELRGLKVLVLEADDGLRRLLARALLRHGANVSVEEDRRVDFDLVVGGDGDYPARTHLLLTDYEQHRPDRLGKPFSLDTFMTRVRYLLSRSDS